MGKKGRMSQQAKRRRKMRNGYPSQPQRSSYGWGATNPGSLTQQSRHQQGLRYRESDYDTIAARHQPRPVNPWPCVGCLVVLGLLIWGLVELVQWLTAPK